MNRRQLLASVAGLTGLGSFAAFPSEVPPPVPDWKDRHMDILTREIEVQETVLSARESRIKTHCRLLETLADVTKVHSSDGYWNYDPYMNGMANGLILALHIMMEAKGAPHYKPPLYEEEWHWSRKDCFRTLTELYPGTGSS